jgi:hypothetical protein
VGRTSVAEGQRTSGRWPGEFEIRHESQPLGDDEVQFHAREM